MKREATKKLNLGKIKIASLSNVSQETLKGGVKNITKSPTCGVTTHSYDPTCH